MTFEAFLDVSGLVGYAACVGSAPLRCDLVPAALVDARAGAPTAQTVTLAGLALPRGTPVFATVLALSGAGAVSSASSNGLVCDDRTPSSAAAVVLDSGAFFTAPPSIAGAGRAASGGVSAVDLDCDFAGAGVGAAWSGFEVFVGLSHYEWAVGSAPGAADLLDWTSVGVSTSIFDASVAAPAGAAVFASVRAVDVAGGTATASSNGVLLLRQPAAAAAAARALASNSSSAANATNATAATAFSAGTFVCVSGPFAAGGVRPTGGAVVLQNN